MVKWSKPAKLDLKQIHGYISRDSRFYAEKVSPEIVEKSEKLGFFPEAGRIVPEIGDAKILALIHGKREFSKDLITAQ